MAAAGGCLRHTGSGARGRAGSERLPFKTAFSAESRRVVAGAVRNLCYKKMYVEQIPSLTVPSRRKRAAGSEMCSGLVLV